MLAQIDRDIETIWREPRGQFGELEFCQFLLAQFGTLEEEFKGAGFVDGGFQRGGRRRCGCGESVPV